MTLNQGKDGRVVEVIARNENEAQINFGVELFAMMNIQDGVGAAQRMIGLTLNGLFSSED
jgi:hypothetical protein